MRAKEQPGNESNQRGLGAVEAPSNRDLGRAIRGLRRARRLTIEDLAFAAGMHPTYLSGIERGVRNPTWGKVRLLAGALGVPVMEVVRRAETAALVQERFERVLTEAEGGVVLEDAA